MRVADLVIDTKEAVITVSSIAELIKQQSSSRIVSQMIGSDFRLFIVGQD